MSEVDVSGLIESIRNVKAAGRVITPEWLNKTAKDIAIKAIGTTPKTPASKIRAELTDQVCRAILARGQNLPKKLAWWRPEAKHTREEWARAIKQLRSARASSSGARKAGWVKAAQGLGGRTGSRVSSAGFPGQSYAKKANPRDLAALIVNHASGAATGADALQKAINLKSADIDVDAQRRLDRALTANSAR